MKLNYKRTFLVGLAFLSICAFWQMYDGIIPLILRDTYHIPDGPAGIVMALDNLLALFLLPLLGAFSDKKGTRMPFIVGGTILAAALMMLIPILVGAYTPDAATTSLFLFFAVLGLLLIAMSLYRSPAVALMADVTPKPLRSQGNAVINLMGAVGGLYTLIMVKLAVRKDAAGNADYFYLFLSVAVLMLLAVGILILTIREKKLVAAMKAINYGVSEEEDQGHAEIVNGKEKLPAPVLKSLCLILASIALWFMGYNAVTTAFTKYATTMWTGGLSNASTCLMVATVGAVASYLPIGWLSAKLGRKKMIFIGLGCAATSFAFAAVFARQFSLALYPMFLLVGFAQAAVTVNTFPMVWEISRIGNVGKYTGYYYTVSMSAQIVTPILSGYLLQWFGYDTLFPYALVMVLLAFVPLSLAKHGDNRPNAPKNKLEAFDVDDD